ncbi:MAG: hypothetical protein H0X40_17210 [Chthoniobacterales bacterium]|nr:hypothetical protein [Chthoniobacterales bacterium]
MAIGSSGLTLTAGATTTIIRNTSGNPISDVFSNLPDGATLSVNENNVQANYEGGDGNDLTLTMR